MPYEGRPWVDLTHGLHLATPWPRGSPGGEAFHDYLIYENIYPSSLLISLLA